MMLSKHHVFLQPDQINKVEVELTNRCNAACPSCSRTDVDGKPIRSLTLSEITLEQFKTTLPKPWIENKEIKLCGVFGDPIVATDLLEIVKYVDECNGRLTINTNASLRNTSFWQNLGQVISTTSQHNGIIFSIDGLQDTNDIYRKNTSWSKIMENANAFIKAGGKAFWDYIAFSHNDHQIEEARNLAKEMGFKKFTLKKTTRSSPEKGSTAIEKSLGIAPSDKSEFRHKNLSPNKKFSINNESGFIFNLFQKKERDIECFARGESHFQKIKDRSLYISANRRLWPCCWYADAEFPQKKEVRQLFKKYGHDFNDLNTHSIDKVLTSPWFQKELVASWYSPKKISAICQKNCDKHKPLNNEDCEDTIYD